MRLLAVSLTLLVIPYAGYRYVSEMEAFLRVGFEQSLLGGARALAGALHGRSSLFPTDTSDAPDFYAHPLSSTIQLDGYSAEWGGVPDLYRELIWETPDTETAPPRVSLGLHTSHIFLLVEVDDSTPMGASTSAPLAGDHIVIRLKDARGTRRHYLIDTFESGPLQAQQLVRDTLGQGQLKRELRIHGVERRTNQGYTLELRIPVALLGGHLGLSVTDARTDATVVRAGSHQPDADLGALILPSEDIAAIITSLGETPGRRVWVVDRQSRVLARGGTLKQAPSVRYLPQPLEWIFGTPSAVRYADTGPVARLERPESNVALSGEASVGWHAVGSGETFVVSAAQPVTANGEVVGAVLVEEASTAVQTARSQALAELFIATLILFGAATVVLALFATSLSARLRLLLRETSAAIDDSGRVVGDLSHRFGNDEIGELASGMRGLLSRLGQYNRYLERLGGRLSHEIRTPLAVIRSSIDNLEHSHEGLDPELVKRAQSGVVRLQTLVTRMGEVARIEEAVRAQELVLVDLRELLSNAMGGYEHVWPQTPFRFRCKGSVPMVCASPDLIVQMLDKLVANAVDFAADDTPVEVSLRQVSQGVQIAVFNYGSRLPDGLEDKLFESMVSVRTGTRTTRELHLGLGLHIVQLVAEGHGGHVKAHQLNAPEGVSIEVTLPTAR